MPAKSKKRSTTTARKPRPDRWEAVASEIMGENSMLMSSQPKNRRPVLARPGMICSPSGALGCAQIEAMTPEICVVRFESGRAEAFYWGEIELAAVQPDPRYLSRRGR